MFWKNKKNSSRKFVDLIWKSSTKWAVWDPPYNNVSVGDYGTVDKATGQFQFKGNIYTNNKLSDITDGHATAEASPVTTEEIIWVTSLNARKVAFDAGISFDAQVAKVVFKSKWSFGAKTGALLVIHKPRHRTLPHNLDLSTLTTHEDLQGMSLVTSVTTCPSYALYLASKEDTGISLALYLQAPGTGAEVSTSWVSDCGAGFYRSGNNNEDCFTVLFDLKQCELKKPDPWFRDSPSPELLGLDRLEQTTPPWDRLDEEGEDQEEFEDEVYEDEF